MAPRTVLTLFCAVALSLAVVPLVGAVAHVPGMMLTSLRQECYAEGEKCIGAPNYPAVPYKPCCSGSCTGNAKDWGMVCVSSGGGGGGSSQGQCYNIGQKCQGAPGYPNVPYLGCCDGECTGAASDWGKVCVAKSSAGGVNGKCYKYGEKCQGAPGFPNVPYLGCCEGECTGAASDWGKICVAKSGGDGNSGSSGKCYSMGERCEGAPGKPPVPYLGCCAGYECTGSHPEWGKICIKKGCRRRRR